MSGSADGKFENFKLSFKVISLPSDLTLSPENRSSQKGALNARLLGKVPGVLSAVSTPPVAIGMGGLAKTCVLKYIGQDEEIRLCFNSGVYWLQLGQEATDALVYNAWQK